MKETTVYLRAILLAALTLPAICRALRRRLADIRGTAVAFLMSFAAGEALERTLLGAGMVFQEAALMATLFPMLLFWWMQAFIRDSLSEGKDLKRERVLVSVALVGCCAVVVILMFSERISGRKDSVNAAAFLSCCSMCAAAFAACGIFRRLSAFEARNRQMERLIQEEECRQRQKQEILTVSEEVRKLRHDMKNSYQLLYGLLEQGKTDEAMTYLFKEAKQLPDIPVIVYTDSAAVNTLLSLKQAQGKEQEIRFTTKMTTNLAGIQDYDMCRLLGNLLDNALEAASRCERGNRKVDLKLYGDDKKCLLEVLNTTPETVLENGMLPATTKEDPENHGLGQSNITDAIEKYNGTLKLSEKDNELRISIILFRKP